MFRAKEVDFDLLKVNLAEAVVTVWSNKHTLSVDDFKSLTFGIAIAKDDKFVTKFLREKLRIIVAVMLICAFKAGASNEQLDELVVAVKTRLKEMNASQLPGLEIGLATKAEEYAKTRMSADTRQAAAEIENRFCKEVFGFVPLENDVNEQYTLYKKLSAMERKSIFAMKAAIRESHI